MCNDFDLGTQAEGVLCLRTGKTWPEGRHQSLPLCL